MPADIIVCVDFETWNIDPINLGIRKYVENLKILMMAWHIVGDPAPAELWRPGMPFPAKILAALNAGAKLSGWNAMNFERIVWQERAVPDHGFPEVPDDIWIDSMHLAAAANLPRGLDACARAVGAAVLKDAEGHRLMLRVTNGNRTPWPPKEEDMVRLGEYCVKDVLTEEATAANLPAWPQVEPWLHMPAIDRKINDRGILVDVELVKGMMRAAAIETARLDGEIAKLTDGNVPKVTNIEGLKRWLVENKVELPPNVPDEDDEPDEETETAASRKSPWKLRKNDIADLLARDGVPDKCREALAMRAEAGKASVSKLKTMLAMTSPDGRLRQAMTLGGAQQTLRWASTRVNLYNTVRDVFANPDEVEELTGFDAKKDKDANHRAARSMLQVAIETGRTGDPDLLRSLYERPRRDAQGRVRIAGVLTWISRMARRTLGVPVGRVMMNGDFAQIEARITVWLAQQLNMLDAFATGKDPYRITAAGIFNTSVEGMSKEMRQVGKVCIAEGSLVLTDKGLVPIEKVSVDSKVWDGVEWVSHDGPVFMGWKETISYDGLEATPDHEVYVEGAARPVELGIAAACFAKLERSSDPWANVRVGEDSIDGAARSHQRELVRTDPVYAMHQDRLDIRVQPGARTQSRLPGMLGRRESKERQDTKIAFESHNRSKTTMRKSERSEFSQLWSERYSVSFSERRGRRTMGYGESRGSVTWDGTGPKRQQRTLRTGQSSVGYTSSANAQYPRGSGGYFQRQTDIEGRSPACRSRYATENIICGSDASTFYSGNEIHRGGAGQNRQFTPIVQTCRPVWDILNAGPRHRFTVSGKLVSNCLLALGFGGGPNALVAMGYAYGLVLSVAEAIPIVKAWREANPQSVAFWYACDDAAANAVMYPGHEFPVAPLGLTSYFMQGDCLCCRLPTGRLLRYWQPRLTQEYWDDEKTQPKSRLSLSGLAVKGRAVFRRSLYHTILVENCLGAWTKVITSHGVKYLVDVQSDDMVWDGVEWVKHQGVVYQGVRETVNFGGVRLTSDHKVMIDEEWSRVGDTSHGEAARSYSEHYRLPIRIFGSDTVPGTGRTAASRVDRAMRLWARTSDAWRTLKTWYAEKLRLSQIRGSAASETKFANAWHVGPSSLRSMAIHVRQMPTAIASRLEKLRWSWNHGVLRVEQQFSGILAGYGFDVRDWPFDRASRQFQRLQQRELLLGDSNSAKQQPPNECIRRYSLGPYDSVARVDSIRNRHINFGLPAGERMSRGAIVRFSRFHEPVYDILNAGPRHRFTVIGDDLRPFLVSNCVQAIGADLLARTLVNADRNNIPVTLHVYDSMGAEIDEDKADAMLPVFEYCMTDQPSWTRGLPIAADVDYGARFG